MTDMIWSFKDEDEMELLHYEMCGLDDVYLKSGYELVETAHGDGLRIKHMEELHKAIGHYLAAYKKVLSGKELRFLRRQMELTQSELGRLVSLTSQQIARWEKETSDPSGAAMALLRIIYLQDSYGGIIAKDLLADLESTDDDLIEKALSNESDDGWRAEAA